MAAALQTSFAPEPPAAPPTAPPPPPPPPPPRFVAASARNILYIYTLGCEFSNASSIAFFVKCFKGNNYVVCLHESDVAERNYRACRRERVAAAVSEQSVRS